MEDPAGNAGNQHTAEASEDSNNPSIAVRTYTCLRLGAIGVIAVLAAAIVREYHGAGDCLQGSISAYYYTSVQSVFVGALVAMGVVMIVLWGKTSWEDGALNLAGLVAPVVAFVPTAKTNLCGLTTASGADVTTQAQKHAVIVASRDAIDNNMLAYLVVVAIALILLVGVGLAPQAAKWVFSTESPWSYWGPWLVAAGLWALGTYAFAQHRAWFYANAHQWSAITLFGFIIVVIVNIGIQKHKGLDTSEAGRSPQWARWYFGLAILMTIGAVVIYFAAEATSSAKAHRTFILETWMILMLAVFWISQTWDRLTDGAPPRATRAPADARLVGR